MTHNLHETRGFRQDPVWKFGAETLTLSSRHETSIPVSEATIFLNSMAIRKRRLTDY